jgi:hypothetical protein
MSTLTAFVFVGVFTNHSHERIAITHTNELQPFSRFWLDSDDCSKARGRYHKFGVNSAVGKSYLKQEKNCGQEITVCEKESYVYIYECHIIVTNARARSAQQNVDHTKWLEKAWEMQAVEMDTL